MDLCAAQVQEVRARVPDGLPALHEDSRRAAVVNPLGVEEIHNLPWSVAGGRERAGQSLPASSWKELAL
jgi:hypothetical protein